MSRICRITPTNLALTSSFLHALLEPVNRTFQSARFQRFPWIHYDAVSDCAFCFTCCKAARQGKVRLTGLAEQAFLIKGFTNWKDATRVFSKHEASDFHKQAVAAMAMWG